MSFLGDIAPWVPAAIPGLGPVMGQINERNAINEENAARQRSFDQNVALQREFAQHGLRWKIADGVAAGVHPLAALGAQGTQFSPMSIDFSSPKRTANWSEQMGQDLTRAMSAASTMQEMENNAATLQHTRAVTRGQEIDNQINQRKLDQMTGGQGGAQTDHDNFIPGQNPKGGHRQLMDVKPVKRGESQPGALHQEAGWRQDSAFSRTKRGLYPVIPDSLAESMEDDPIGKIQWHRRNTARAYYDDSFSSAPAKSQLPKGYSDWEFDALDGWYPVKNAPRTPWKRFKDAVSDWQLSPAQRRARQRSYNR